MRKMVHVSDFEIFSNQCSTLKETSKDHHGEEELYMTDSLMEVVDFDTITPTETIGKSVLVAIAVYIGKTRLIDNFIVEA